VLLAPKGSWHFQGQPFNIKVLVRIGGNGREITSWLSAMARGVANGHPHPKCIDVMEGVIIEELVTPFLSLFFLPLWFAF